MNGQGYVYTIDFASPARPYELSVLVGKTGSCLDFDVKAVVTITLGLERAKSSCHLCESSLYGRYKSLAIDSQLVNGPGSFEFDIDAMLGCGVDIQVSRIVDNTLQDETILWEVTFIGDNYRGNVSLLSLRSASLKEDYGALSVSTATVRDGSHGSFVLSYGQLWSPCIA